MKQKIRLVVTITAILGIFLSCGEQKPAKQTVSGLRAGDFQTVVEGDTVDLYVLRNHAGMEVSITNYGGRIVSLMVPDKAGNPLDVVLGFDNIQDYLSQPSSFGATVGRYANRIAHGLLVLDEDTIQLEVNSGAHTIHGGHGGWQHQVFKASQLSDSVLVLTRFSPDGEGGFPGDVTVEVTYTLTSQNALAIDYGAHTSERTVINMTNHSFFNLSGDPDNPILDNQLYVNASHFTPIDTTLIPTGELRPVANSPFDFMHPKSIDEGVQRDVDDEQLRIAKGYDHNWVLDTDGDVAVLAASLYSPISGIAMEVYTNEPGIQVYTGNMLDGSRTGKAGHVYHKQRAICLETQHFPDSPNNPTWPSTLLQPGDTFRSTCIYKFVIPEE